MNNWEKAEEFLAKDKYIGPLIKKYGPCKIKPIKPSDYFLDLVESVVSQQLSGKAAKTIFGRVKAGLGKITPELILKTKDDKFREWGLSRQKTSYIKDLALKIKNNEVEITKINKLTDEKIIGELVKVKGIGIWTAKMFLMFTLGREDVFPHEDLGIKNGIRKLLGKQYSSQEMEDFAVRWKPYRTIASWYVWANLDNR